MLKRTLLALSLTLAATLPAFAHLDPAEHGSFAAGFSHPLFGLDHILAMVAVGLWAAQQGGRAMWLVPAAFVGTMAVGFGFAIALALPIPMAAVAGLVGFFAFFHGHAHGGELGDAGAWQFAIGFVLSTAALHVVGIAAGLLLARTSGKLLTRAVGAATAFGGLWLAFGA